MSEPEKICSDIAPLLDAFFDGELNESERQSVDKHVTTCEKCQLKLGEIGRLVKTLKDMPQLLGDLGLQSVPHFTTLQKAAQRMLEQAPVQQLLDTTVERYRKKVTA